MTALPVASLSLPPPPCRSIWRPTVACSGPPWTPPTSSQKPPKRCALVCPAWKCRISPCRPSHPGTPTPSAGRTRCALVCPAWKCARPTGCRSYPGTPTRRHVHAVQVRVGGAPGSLRPVASRPANPLPPPTFDRCVGPPGRDANCTSRHLNPPLPTATAGARWLAWIARPPSPATSVTLHIQAHQPAPTHTHTPIHTLSLTHTHTHTYTHSLTHTRICTHSLTHTHTHKFHALTHTHIHTHSLTHTHTHLSCTYMNTHRPCKTR